MCFKFPKLSEAKLKQGVFTGSDIRKLQSDPIFTETMRDKEKEACTLFKDVVRWFFGNTEAYETQGCKTSLKVHFLHSYVNCFPNNLGAYSAEQGERFHQDICDVERRYQGRLDINILADTVGCSDEKQKVESITVNKGVSKKRRNISTDKMSKHSVMNI